MTLFEHLQSRNLVHNHTPHIQDYLIQAKQSGKTPAVYAGFDPSGASLQIGNLMAVLLLRRAQMFGVKPLVLLGGATGLIGDPSGKKAERTLLDSGKAEENLEKIKKQLSHFIDFSPGQYSGQFVNNYDWFKEMNFVHFLRDVGKHITINYMIAKDSVKLRMETGISYAEFGYMLMQGYDFLHLYEKYGCLIQIGGSDQWGNIVTGIELIRKKHGAEAHAISSPLLTDSSGNKLGKTEAGAIYLDGSMTSPYQFYQFLLNTADADIIKIAECLTLANDDELKSIKHELASSPDKRFAQKWVARNLTNLVHGSHNTDAAEKATAILFSKDPAALDQMTKESLQILAQELPSSKQNSVSGLGILDILVQTKICESKGEARRALQGGSISINRQKITDEKATMTDDLLNEKGFLLLALGKQKLHLITKV